MKVRIIQKLRELFSSAGRPFSGAKKKIEAFIQSHSGLARFVYITFPMKRKEAADFLRRNKKKIIIPAAFCLFLTAILGIITTKYTANSDYYPEGDSSAEFAMVLQNYNTFDHIEKTHIAVRLNWTDGAIDLQDGIAKTKIKAKVYPINLKSKDIIWTLSNKEIATIDQEGNIEATAPGKTDIFARLDRYDKVSKARLTIKQPVSSIVLPTSTMTVILGGSARYLNVRVFPENATNKTIKWQSKDISVARVDQNGTVKPVSVGMTEIIAESEDSGYQARCFVTVVNPSVEVEKITLQNREIEALNIGDSINAVITVAPANAKDKTVKWSSDNTLVATVSQTGRIKAIGPGEANITVKSVNGTQLTFAVKVNGNQQSNNQSGAEYRSGPSSTLATGDGTVTYTTSPYNLPQAVRIQMSQNPAPKIWKNNGVVYASEMETADYMNPNNYYEDAYKYQFLDLSKTSGVSADTLNAYLAGKGVLDGMGQAFIDAANTYGVNEVYLMAHCCLETGNGTSQLSNGVEVNGETVYNLFGIAAYDDSALYSGSQKAYKEGWFSVEAAIMGGAKWISDYYINSSETRQNTLYKMLWNPEDPGVHQYATDVGWAVKQAVSMNRIFEQMPDAVYSYDIPVYDGMIPPTISQ